MLTMIADDLQLGELRIIHDHGPWDALLAVIRWLGIDAGGPELG
jgi:hypothetical protein